MRTIDEIKENLDLIATVLEEPRDEADIGAVVLKGEKLIELSATAAQCEASAKALMNLALAKAIKSNLQLKLPATILKQLAEAESGNEIACYEYAVRINRFISHAMDFLRSIISLHKEELNNALRFPST